MPTPQRVRLPSWRRRLVAVVVLFGVVAAFFGAPRSAERARDAAVVAAHGHARLVALRHGAAHVERVRRIDDRATAAVSAARLCVAPAAFARTPAPAALPDLPRREHATPPLARGPPPSA
jgi:hypothetical protein